MEPDKLVSILMMQDSLNTAVSASREEFINMSREEKTMWVNRFLMAISNECEELRNCFPFKWWKKNQEFDLNSAKEEWIDIFHFVLSLGLALGFDTDGAEIYRMYMNKNHVNHERQNSGTY